MLEIPSFWFDVTSSGELVRSSLPDDKGEATCKSQLLLDDLVNGEQFSPWLQGIAPELWSGLLLSTRQFTTRLKHATQKRKWHQYTLTLSVNSLQTDESLDLESHLRDLPQMCRVAVISQEEEEEGEGEEKGRAERHGTPANVGPSAL